MSGNLSRLCRCAHRHLPGPCTVRACGCTRLRTDLDTPPPVRILRDVTLVSWGPALYPPWPNDEAPGGSS